jgi:hypothetical protein
LDNFKVGCIAGDSDGGPFPFMHARIMENLACECTTKKGTQPTSERKSHGERKRKKVRFDDKTTVFLPTQAQINDRVTYHVGSKG